MVEPHQLRQIPQAAVLDTGSGDGQIPSDMNARLTKLEATVDGLKRVQDITVLSVLGVGALIITVMVYGLVRTEQIGERIEKVNERVVELPSKISSELRDITKTLAESITAAKQAQTQVILVPQVQPPTPPTRPQQ